MSADRLTSEARLENARALAVALGVSVGAADEALDMDVEVTAEVSDPIAQLIALEVRTLVNRTVQRRGARVASKPSAELVIGAATTRTSAPHVFLTVFSDNAVITSSPGPRAACAPIPPLIGLLCAAYAAGQLIAAALGSRSPAIPSERLEIPFNAFCDELATLSGPIEIGQVVLAGAGAIGNGLIWAARHVDLRGEMIVVDDDRVSAGNLNRQVWFEVDDVGAEKSTRLVQKAQRYLPNLRMEARFARLQDLRTSGPWLGTLVSAVDSRRARRQLQAELPGEVFDASTTDTREIVFHYNNARHGQACLACIYAEEESERSREVHIAQHLGVSADEVKSARISPEASIRIADRFSGIHPGAIEGVAYDSLFKQLCSAGELRTLEGRAIVAPFAFVSVLAGTVLLLDILRKRTGGAASMLFNYWRISPWKAPIQRRQILRAKESDCELCSNATIAAVRQSLWCAMKC